jgi:hypothetical protein
LKGGQEPEEERERHPADAMVVDLPSHSTVPSSQSKPGPMGSTPFPVKPDAQGKEGPAKKECMAHLLRLAYPRGRTGSRVEFGGEVRVRWIRRSHLKPPLARNWACLTLLHREHP